MASRFGHNPASMPMKVNNMVQMLPLLLSFLQGVPARLGLDESFIFPAFEDLFYYMWRERKLPDQC
jgi:hypothetical protein